MLPRRRHHYLHIVGPVWLDAKPPVPTSIETRVCRNGEMISGGEGMGKSDQNGVSRDPDVDLRPTSRRIGDL